MNNPYIFRKATDSDAGKIWQILQQAIERRRQDGSLQWQDGYPNEDTVKEDIEKGVGFLLSELDTPVAYCALILNDEPAYDNIDGKWLTNGDFYVVHRVAVSTAASGKGLASEIFERLEQHSKENNIFSVKVDTNFDNPAMIRTLEKRGYIYCGEVFLRGAVRRAYEKILQADEKT